MTAERQVNINYWFLPFSGENEKHQNLTISLAPQRIAKLDKPNIIVFILNICFVVCFFFHSTRHRMYSQLNHFAQSDHYRFRFDQLPSVHDKMESRHRNDAQSVQGNWRPLPARVLRTIGVAPRRMDAKNIEVP